MRNQKNGLIINISSTSGVSPSPGWDIYGASKFALEGLSEAVAATVKSFGIEVVVIEPGTTATNFMTESTELGNRIGPETEVYVAYSLLWMKERLADGQDPRDVAFVFHQL